MATTYRRRRLVFVIERFAITPIVIVEPSCQKENGSPNTVLEAPSLVAFDVEGELSGRRFLMWMWGNFRSNNF
jgi:hypothetical protein